MPNTLPQWIPMGFLFYQRHWAISLLSTLVPLAFNLPLTNFIICKVATFLIIMFWYRNPPNSNRLIFYQNFGVRPKYLWISYLALDLPLAGILYFIAHSLWS